MPLNLKQIFYAVNPGPVQLANLLSLFFSLLVVGLVIILVSLFGWTPTTPYIVAVGLVFWIVILLNNAGYTLVGRMIFCLVPIWGTFFISLYGKINIPNQSYIIYFDSRYILLATTILPGIVFELKEKIPLGFCLASTFFCLILFDPIHNLMGVGYYQRGFTALSYYYINYITLISGIAVMAGVLILKWQHAQASGYANQNLQSSEKFSRELAHRNHQLEQVTKEVEAQNEELMQQQEELTSNQEKLAAAYDTISQQSIKLETYNQQLEKLVEQKSGDLLKTNEELVKSNNELAQFSFSVSHNLRAPVARLLGLTALLHVDKRPADLDAMLQHIGQSAQELDSILYDLSSIIEIRSALYRVKEKIEIKAELRKALSLIGEADMAGVNVNLNLREPLLFGIRPMIQSILYNLISNSIKYKSPNRPLTIDITSTSTGFGTTILELTDNGIGIDLKKHGHQLFQLYKRFNSHVSGKGLGLYMVKTQMEIMNGQVDVTSEPDKGCCFRLTFSVPEDVAKQVFFENDSAQLYYDAYINNTVIVWKKNVTSHEYRAAFESVLQTIRKYNTPGWIADLRDQGVIDTEDQKWFITHVLRPAAENGLKRIAAIGFDDPIRKEYYERMIAKTAELGIQLKVFHELQPAVEWMKAAAKSPA